MYPKLGKVFPIEYSNKTLRLNTNFFNHMFFSAVSASSRCLSAVLCVTQGVSQLSAGQQGHLKHWSQQRCLN